MNWEDFAFKNRELGVVRLHIFNSRKIPGPKKRELGGHTVYRTSNFKHECKYILVPKLEFTQ